MAKELCSERKDKIQFWNIQVYGNVEIDSYKIEEAIGDAGELDRLDKTGLNWIFVTAINKVEAFLKL